MGRKYPKGRRLRKAEVLIRRPPRGNGEINFSLVSLNFILRHSFVFPFRRTEEAQGGEPVCSLC